MKTLVDGKQVRLESDPTQDNRDKYKRLLRYVYLSDGTFVNKKMIEGGYAYEYTYEVPYQFQTVFKDAQARAEQQEAGLWGKTTCSGEK
jgi:micrococcal nuclease